MTGADTSTSPDRHFPETHGETVVPAVTARAIRRRFAPGQYLQLAARTIAQHGLRHTLGELVAEWWFDARRGTSTFCPEELNSRQLSRPAAADGVRYQGASPRLVRELLAQLPAIARQALFVDYGSGKGRVLILAAESGFARRVGLECSPELTRMCEKNLRHAEAARSAVHPPVELRVQDAVLYEPPPGPLVAFLYNPFRGETLRKVVARLRAHAAREPGRVWVVYANPCELSVFTGAGFSVTHEVRRRGHLLGVTLESGPVPDL